MWAEQLADLFFDWSEEMICMLGSRYARRDFPEGEDTHAYIGAGERLRTEPSSPVRRDETRREEKRRPEGLQWMTLSCFPLFRGGKEKKGKEEKEKNETKVYNRADSLAEQSETKKKKKKKGII